MKGKPDLVKASQVAAAAKKVGGVYVVATRNQQLPAEENASAQIAKYPVAEYSCKECATVFTANEGMAAHCLTCGSSHTEVSARKETAGKASRTKVHADEELNHYVCAGCGTVNILHSAVVAACGTGIHCVGCGHHNTIVRATTADIDAPAGDGVDDMDMVDTSDEALEAEAEGDDSMDGDLEDLGDETLQASDDNDADDTGLDEEDAPAEADALDVETSPLNPAPVPAADIPGQGADTNPVVDVAPGTPSNVEYSEDEGVDVDLLDLNEDTPVEELSFAWVGNTLGLVTASFQVVATQTEADAGTHADIRTTAEFARAAALAIKKDGLKKACAALGFKAVKAKMPIARIVKAAVEKELASKAAELTAKLESVHQDFSQATEISAAGFAKNFWKNASDPLKSALITELSTLGIKNPNKLVDRVWALHAAKTMASILDKAKELSKTSVTARNELASALDMTNYVPTKTKVHAEAEEEDTEPEDEDDDTTVESRLTAGAKAITDREAVHSSAYTGKPGSGKTMINSILSGRVGHFNH